MNDALFAKAQAIKSALDAAERAHPNSKALKALHARLGEALAEARVQDEVDATQYTTLGGGTPKD